MFRPYHQAFTMNQLTIKLQHFLVFQTMFTCNDYKEMSVMCYVGCRRFIQKFYTSINGNHFLNLLTPNDHYSGRTAPLTSKRCILYIYSTNIYIYTEYFKHGIYSPFFPLQNAVCFINLTYLVPVLFTIYIQSVLKVKK